MRLAIVGNFGLSYKATMSARAVPIAASLARLGYLPSIFVPVEASGADSVTPPALLPETVRLVTAGPVHSPIALGRAVQHLYVGLRLTILALRSRPDVLYAFKPKGYAGLALLVFWALKKLRLHSAVLALDTDDWEGSGGWADHEARPRWTTWLVNWQERWCLGHAEVVTVASRELARLADREVVYVPNAASPSSPGWAVGNRERGRSRLGLGDAPVVLAYTRFFEFGPRRLVDVFRQIRARVPGAHLVVIGKGLGNEDAELAALARDISLDSVVHHLGWGRLEDLPDLFAAADVAVYPLDDTRLNRAKCPMKLVDLLLAGVPVVADAVGQTREYLNDDRTGRLVPAGDVGAMADAAADLLAEPTRARSLGAAAREEIPRRWNWEDQSRAIARALERARNTSENA